MLPIYSEKAEFLTLIHISVSFLQQMDINLPTAQVINK